MDDSSNVVTFLQSEENIFEMDVDMIINPVNCKGVSGAGLAKAFKEKFPVSQKRYESVCKQTMMVTDPTGIKRKVAAFRPGDILHFIDINIDRVRAATNNGNISSLEKEDLENLLLKRQHVVFFPTKNHWKNPSKYEYIESGMRSLANLLKKDDVSVSSVAIPALGCGLGGLDPETVSKIIIRELSDLGEIKIYLLSPLTIQ